MSPEPVVNFFELFGVPTTFAIDARRLDRAYRELQTQAHPDRHAAAGSAEQLHAARWAMLANEAYRTLKDAVGRAVISCICTASIRSIRQCPRHS